MAKLNGIWCAGLLPLLMATSVWAGTFTSSQSGPWNVASTWGGSGPPVAGDTVTIQGGNTVTIPDNTACACAT